MINYKLRPPGQSGHRGGFKDDTVRLLAHRARNIVATGLTVAFFVLVAEFNKIQFSIKIHFDEIQNSKSEIRYRNDKSVSFFIFVIKTRLLG